MHTKADKVQPILSLSCSNRASLIGNQMHLLVQNNPFPAYLLSKRYIQKLYNSCTNSIHLTVK